MFFFLPWFMVKNKTVILSLLFPCRKSTEFLRYGISDVPAGYIYFLYIILYWGVYLSIYLSLYYYYYYKYITINSKVPRAKRPVGRWPSVLSTRPVDGSEEEPSKEEIAPINKIGNYTKGYALSHPARKRDPSPTSSPCPRRDHTYIWTFGFPIT